MEIVNQYLQALADNNCSMGYTFGALTQPKEVVTSEQVGLSVTPLNNGVPTDQGSVGLSMAGLIDQTYVQQLAPSNPQPMYMHDLVQPCPTQTPEYVDPSENPKFSELLNTAVDPSTIKQKFGIRPLEEGVDLSMLPKPNAFEEAINQMNAHLSKNNQPTDQVGGRKVNNWFTRLLDQRGQDYISSGKLTIDEVNRNAERILDDIIAGRIDYGKQGQFIINPVVIDTLISYCANKLAINRAIQYSLGYVYNDYTNRMMLYNDQERLQTLSAIDDSQSRNISQAIAIVNQDIGIYDILFQKLQYVRATGNASSLFSLSNDLNNYRKTLKKRY